MKKYIVFLFLLIANFVNAQSSGIFILKKPGTLKNEMKGCEGLTAISISGVINEKDLLYIFSLPNLQTLDLSNASLKPKINLAKLCYIDAKNILLMKSLDTLKVGRDPKIGYSDYRFPEGRSCFNSFYYILNPRYYILDGIKYINYYTNKPYNNYSGIEAFPDRSASSRKALDEQFKIEEGTLFLPDAIKVFRYFDGDFTRVIFSKKIKRIGSLAFDNYKLDDVIFEDGTDVDIDERAFIRDKIKRIRVPKGQIEKFVSLGFPKYILIDQTPNIIKSVEVKKAGTLAQELGNVNLKLIKQLTIKGELNSMDFDIINKMLSLETLDIKDTYVYIPVSEKQKEASLVADLFGLASDAQYQKDRNSFNYKMRKGLKELVEKGYDTTTSCELPKNAFRGNPVLETLKLPSSLTKINQGGIGGSDDYYLSNKKHIKRVWLSRKTMETVPIKKIFEKKNIEILYYE